MSGRTLEHEHDPNAPVVDLVQTIDELLGTGERPRVVCCNGRRLNVAGTLAMNDVKDQTTLHYILAPVPGLPSLFTNEADRARAYGLAGSLYARCGGIFGVAGFVDRCMDAWMADPTLNANNAVATWHQRAQRCGFKFLVTQLMGYLCGGPQVYTGRDMAASHKHLAITPDQWWVPRTVSILRTLRNPRIPPAAAAHALPSIARACRGAFMATLASACDGVGLPAIDMADLLAVISSMQEECVLAPGEKAPRKPKPALYGEGTLYAKLGGVYPIALFCDRIVDALLNDRTVKIPLDAKRSSASLKYLFTELVCNKCGGPETLTAKGYEETRLLASSKELFQLLRCAEAASDHITFQPLRTELMQTIYAARDLILDPARTEHDDPNGYVKAIESIVRETTVPMAYAPFPSPLAACHALLSNVSLGDTRQVYPGRRRGLLRWA